MRSPAATSLALNSAAGSRRLHSSRPWHSSLAPAANQSLHKHSELTSLSSENKTTTQACNACTNKTGRHLHCQIYLYAENPPMSMSTED